MTEQALERRTQRVVASIGGTGALVLLAISREFDDRARGLLIAAVVGAALLFALVAAYIGTRRDSR